VKQPGRALRFLPGRDEEGVLFCRCRVVSWLQLTIAGLPDFTIYRLSGFPGGGCFYLKRHEHNLSDLV
jgi:hypothetical protein